MAIKRYYATKDNTITNAFKSNLSTRGVSGNMGQSDIIEVFSIYAQVSSSTGYSSELARILIEFDTTAINTDRTAGNIPASLSCLIVLISVGRVVSFIGNLINILVCSTEEFVTCP